MLGLTGFAIILIFVTEAVASPLHSLNHDNGLARAPEDSPVSRMDISPITISNRVPVSDVASYTRQGNTSLIADAPKPYSLQPRDLPEFAGMTWRIVKVYIFDPVGSELLKIGADMDEAFLAYQRALESIKADHPPLFRLSLTYGALQLRFDCPNPMNLDSVKEIVGFFAFTGRIFPAALKRIYFRSAYGIAILVTFGILPELFPRGLHNVVTGLLG